MTLVDEKERPHVTVEVITWNVALPIHHNLCLEHGHKPLEPDTPEHTSSLGSRSTNPGDDRMPRQITVLTDAQRARFPEWVDKWIKIGLDTTPINMDAVTEAAHRLYHVVDGLPEKPEVIFAKSPLEMSKRGPTEVGIRNKESDDQIAERIRREWGQYRGGNLWAAWFAYVTFLRDVMNWEHPVLERFAADEAMCLNCNMYWPGTSFVVVCDRPEHISMDDDKKLHNEHGMAAKWRDGWGLWMIGGVSVDEQIVMTPESQTLDQIKNEENEEVKRIRIERYAGQDKPGEGWERYLSEIGAKVVNERENVVENTREALMECDGMKVLVCHCTSTARVYGLEVPAETENCRDAQIWLRGGGVVPGAEKMNIIGRT